MILIKIFHRLRLYKFRLKGFGVLPSSLQTSLLFHILPLPLDVVIGNVADHIRVRLNPQGLRIIRDLCKFSLCRFELGVILDIGLNLTVFREAFILWCIRDNGRFRLGNMCSAIGQLLKPCRIRA